MYVGWPEKDLTIDGAQTEQNYKDKNNEEESVPEYFH